MVYNLLHMVNFLLILKSKANINDLKMAKVSLYTG